MSTPRCDNCRYSRPRALDSSDRAQTLRCHRLPPVRMVYEAESAYGYMPGVDDDGWCGEYAPRNPETIDEAAVTLARFVILGDRTAAYALVDKLKELKET